jgi:hypothetical protein
MQPSLPTPLQRRDVRWLVALAAVLVASGLFHVVVWAFDGGPWAGPVTWRKPIVFGLSGGITTASLAWVLAHLPEDRRSHRLAKVYTIAMLVEITLITVQKWRGVGSHFNQSSALDGAVFTLMGILILVASWPIVAWTIDVARARTLAPDRRAALFGGLMLLDLGLLVGLGLAIWGSAPVGGGEAVTTAARELKLPHAIALHGIQALPIARWLLERIGIGASRRTWILGRLALAHGALVLAAVAQALLGLPPDHPSAAALAILTVGLVLPWQPWANGALGLPAPEVSA